MPDAVRAGVGRAAVCPRFAVGVLTLTAAFGPLAATVGLEVERPELVQAEHDLGFDPLGQDLAARDGVEVLDAGLLTA
ncbi:hypothetical protein [Micromonospora sp. DT227]|uniref:hypothetical protein n=1 Tax=Micromonospora sp. DT227 TaxID=3393433 RepID=UPI003CF3A1E0